MQSRLVREVTIRRPRTTRSGRTSESDEIQLYFLVVVIARPEIERRACDLVHDGDRDSEASEIDGLQIVFTGVTGVDTKMVERRRTVVAETTFVFFAASRAPDAGDRPPGETRRAQQLPAAAVAFAGAFEDRQLRHTAAERT